MIFQLFLFLFFVEFITPLIIGIDLGSEFIKVGIKRRGHPIDIILNEQSKRKTLHQLTIQNGERSFGFHSKKERFPLSTVERLNLLIGQPFDDNPLTNLFRNDYNLPLKFKKNKFFGTYNIEIENEEYPVEELLSFILTNIKTLVEKQSSERITECVIAIPAYYTFSQRQALKSACKLSNLKCTSFVNSGTALAIQYGITNYKKFKETSNYNVLFYDLGSSSLKLSLAKFIGSDFTNPSSSSSSSSTSTSSSKKKDTNLGKVEMLGFEYSNIGGKIFDKVICDHFLDIYLSQFLNKDIHEISNYDRLEFTSKNPKSIAKLMKEANKIKTILSVNNEIFGGTIESFHNSVAFRYQKFTTKEFTDLLSEKLDLQTLLITPITKLLSRHGLVFSDLSSFEFFGGVSRIPFIKEFLKSHFFREYEYEYNTGGGEFPKLRHSMNSDEAIAIGSTFYGISKSSQLIKLKTFQSEDIYPYPISFFLSLKKFYKKGQNRKNHISEMKNYDIFEENSVVGDKSKSVKNINIPRKNNFTIFFNHPQIPSYMNTIFTNTIFKNIQNHQYSIQNDFSNRENTFLKYDIFGMDKFLNNSEEKNITNSRVKLSFELTPFGCVEITENLISLEKTIWKNFSEFNSTVNKTLSYMKAEEIRDDRILKSHKLLFSFIGTSEFSKNLNSLSTPSVDEYINNYLIQPSKKRIRNYLDHEKLKFEFSKLKNTFETKNYNLQSEIINLDEYDEEYDEYPKEEHLSNFYSSQEFEELEDMITKNLEFIDDHQQPTSFNNKNISELMSLFNKKLGGLEDFERNIMNRKKEFISRKKELSSCLGIIKNSKKSISKITSQISDLQQKFRNELNLALNISSSTTEKIDEADKIHSSALNFSKILYNLYSPNLWVTTMEIESLKNLTVTKLEEIEKIKSNISLIDVSKNYEDQKEELKEFYFARSITRSCRVLKSSYSSLLTRKKPNLRILVRKIFSELLKKSQEKQEAENKENQENLENKDPGIDVKVGEEEVFNNNKETVNLDEKGDIIDDVDEVGEL